MADEITIEEEDGTIRYLGNIQGPLKYSWAPMDEVTNVPLIPRDQWKPVSLASYAPPIRDQNGYGSCNAQAAINAMEACRAIAHLPHVTLSTGYLYGSINGQQDRGSMLEDALDWMLKHGAPPASVVPELDWQKGKWPPDAAEKAKPYRFLEAYWCPTFAHCVSAIMRGFTLDIGVMWYQNFKLDGDGWLPKRGSGQPGGHALMAHSVVMRGNEVGLGVDNSWKPSWGINGRCVIGEEHFEGPVGGYWALRAVVSEATDVPGPVV